MIRGLLVLFLVVFAPVLAVDRGWAVDRGHLGEPSDLVICGTGDSQRLFRQLGDVFMALYPGMQVVVPDSIGTSGGIKATAAGKCDLGRVARVLKEKEKRYNLHYRAIAKSPVVFVVNDTVTGVEEISGNEIVAIYSGTFTDWQQLGGAAGKIYVVNREKGDSSRTIIEKKIPGFDDIEPLAGVILYTTPEAVDAIAKYPQTIGYTSMAQTLQQPGARVLNLNGVAPTTENVTSGRYPLLVPFGLVWSDSLKPVGHKFLQFLSSPTALQLMIEHGVLPVAAHP